MAMSCPRQVATFPFLLHSLPGPCISAAISSYKFSLLLKEAASSSIVNENQSDNQTVTSFMYIESSSSAKKVKKKKGGGKNNLSALKTHFLEKSNSNYNLTSFQSIKVAASKHQPLSKEFLQKIQYTLKFVLALNFKFKAGLGCGILLGLIMAGFDIASS